MLLTLLASNPSDQILGVRNPNLAAQSLGHAMAQLPYIGLDYPTSSKHPSAHRLALPGRARIARRIGHLDPRLREPECAQNQSILSRLTAHRSTHHFVGRGARTDRGPHRQLL